jgi:stalled ribosome rescue protein Dom34
LEDGASLESHNGASWLAYAYSKMLSHSYPGKEYSGTKKQLATFITEFGSSLKKDAETDISNYNILNSKRSDVNFKAKQAQVYGIPIVIDTYSSGTLKSFNKFLKNGEYYAIKQYSITNNNLQLVLNKYNRTTKTWESVESDPIQINTLYDI